MLKCCHLLYTTLPFLCFSHTGLIMAKTEITCNNENYSTNHQGSGCLTASEDVPPAEATKVAMGEHLTIILHVEHCNGTCYLMVKGTFTSDCALDNTCIYTAHLYRIIVRDTHCRYSLFYIMNSWVNYYRLPFLKCRIVCLQEDLYKPAPIAIMSCQRIVDQLYRPDIGCFNINIIYLTSL